MRQYADSIARLLQYGFKVIPEVHRQAESLILKQKLCSRHTQNPSSANTEVSIAEQLDIAALCSYFFALYPGADMKSTLSFILSLYLLSETLGIYRFKTAISGETEIHKLYSCLSCAVDPSRSPGCAMATLSMAAAGQEKEAALSLCLSDQCRLQLAILPSYPLVAPKLKKYMQFYIDLQSYRHYPAKIRSEHLKAWSEYYLKRFQEISCWEFCAASDSLLGIIAMYCSAANPDMAPEEIRLLDEACFPWLCGLDSLLRAYTSARVSTNTENLNFTTFYKNLKTCEERLLFFASKAEEACMKLKESSFFMSLISTMIGISMTDPEASFGMYRLASLNILKKVSSQTVFYRNACKLMRLYHIF